MYQLRRRREDKLKEEMVNNKKDVMEDLVTLRVRHAEKLEKLEKHDEENKSMIAQVGNTLTAANDTIEAFGKMIDEQGKTIDKQGKMIDEQGKMIHELFDKLRDIDEYKLRDIDQQLSTIDADIGALHDNVYGDLNDFKDDVLPRCATMCFDITACICRNVFDSTFF